MNCFMFANMPDDPRSAESVAAFPKVLSNHMHDLSQSGPKFCKDPAKQGTGRRALGEVLPGVHSYTLELSFYSAANGNVKGENYSPQSYTDMGVGLGFALHEYFSSPRNDAAVVPQRVAPPPPPPPQPHAQPHAHQPAAAAPPTQQPHPQQQPAPPLQPSRRPNRPMLAADAAQRTGGAPAGAARAGSFRAGQASARATRESPIDDSAASGRRTSRMSHAGASGSSLLHRGVAATRTL